MITDIRFCYRVDAKAGLAHDLETGENTDAFVQVKFGGAKRLPENYDQSHKEMGLKLAKQYGWEDEWVIPISEVEYDAEVEEEDFVDDEDET